MASSAAGDPAVESSQFRLDVQGSPLRGTYFARTSRAALEVQAWYVICDYTRNSFRRVASVTSLIP